MTRIAITAGIRTPFVKAFTEFDSLPAKELARIAFSELLERTGLKPDLVDELILGTVATTTDAANIARVVSLLTGIPHRKRAVTVSRNCASGIESVTSAVEKINIGLDEIVLCGGTESMSNVPLLYDKRVQTALMKLPRANALKKVQILWGIKSLFFRPIIGLKDALSDPVCGLNMGQTAEVLAKEFGISRKDQDEYALMSHLRAKDARGRLREEIVPVYVGPKYKKVIDYDNGVRENQSMEALAKLKPAFERKTGTVTAGNSSQLTDGAAALLVMSEEKAKSLNLEPLGYINSYAYEGTDPKRMGLGPAYAIPAVLKESGMKLNDIDLIEINEAFAAQIISCERALQSKEFCKKELGLDEAVGKINRDILNVNGGGIALGHPVGTSGTRIILTLLMEMKRRGAKRGLASCCVGGGQGAAIILERD